jgi:transposase InsO family protein
MSRKANCYDNAFIESFWNTLKTECTARETFATRTAAALAVFDYTKLKVGLLKHQRARG